MENCLENMAADYCKSTLVGGNYVKKNAYIQGGMDILKEVLMTLSVSTTPDWAVRNIKLMVKRLKGDLTFDNQVLDDNLGL